MAILEDDGALRELLERCRTIAVLGIKSGQADDAYRVPLYLQRAGYHILPINPKLDRLLNHVVVDRIAALDVAPDLVNVFRDPRHLPGHVDEILALDPLPRGVWLQLGIRDDASATRLSAAGIDVVQDRCLMVEHARLLGGAAR